MTTNVLVTGGAGFIGSHYVRTLLGQHGDPSVAVTVLDSLTYAANPANLAPLRGNDRFSFVRGDICDAPLVEELMAGHDQVVHFAAESHVDRSVLGAAAFVRTNVVGTQTLLDAALRHAPRTFVHISTDEVYGSVEVGFSGEMDPLRPSSPYAATKASSDLLALSYHHTHGLDVRITRCSNNYGTHQHPEKVIPRFVTTLLNGGRVPLYGDGGNRRNWLHVEDHVDAVELVRKDGSAGEIYNVGGGTELTNKDLTAILLDVLGLGPDSVEFVTDRKGHDRRYAVDHGKIAGQLGYRPRRDFSSSLARTVEWYRENRDWWEYSAASGITLQGRQIHPAT
ncbi:dTDP-glucose 4,6-dehydratase [Streptomyces sp. NPDC012389]|uniref:dTDP-glucose 4,6-dehydratase n=1 Tax=unclassified Streptomyces TaxID=2593676 RepID=UPI00081E2E55|nr:MULTISPECIES: dTDP-glucose 4,6-dehydratase [unclassified Streptomyces]MYR96312.1 dTDP-glucose 4,6-dehydratase [Streptomyces sp. SID4937]SCE07292.1 dTDP-glucose 4,6-dehydratase [Streptomyces sp. ScaeMP-e83]